MSDLGQATAESHSAVGPTAAAEGAQRSQLRLAMGRFVRHRPAMISLFVLVAVAIPAMLGGIVAPYGYDELVGAFSEPPSRRHLMGTDTIGHDVFSQVLRGTQKSIQVALVVTAIATSFGVTVGLVAGFYRGWIDVALSRLVDFVIIVPVLAVMLAAASAISHRSNSWVYVALLLAAFLWPTVALVVRGSVLSLRERDFIQAAQAIGMGDLRIMVRHLLPNMIGPITVSATLMVVNAILLEAALAFLGFGIAPPDTSLGKLVAVGQSASNTRPWLFYFPGLVLLTICLCVNFVGDGLRDAFDPKQSRRARRAARKTARKAKKAAAQRAAEKRATNTPIPGAEARP